MLALSFSAFDPTETSNLIASEADWVPFPSRWPAQSARLLSIAQGAFSGVTRKGQLDASETRIRLFRDRGHLRLHRLSRRGRARACAGHHRRRDGHHGEAAAAAFPARQIRGRRGLLLRGRRQGRRLGAAGRSGEPIIPPDAIVRRANYLDNPWFPDASRSSRRLDWTRLR